MKKILDRWIDFSAKFPFIIVLIALVISAGSVTLWVTHMRIDAQLEALLPKNSPTLASLKETQKRFGSTDMYTIAIQSKDPIQVAHIQDQLLKDLSHWDDVVSAQAERSQQFFSDHALYYLPDSELVKIATALDQERQGLKNYNPLLADLDPETYGLPKVNYHPDPELPNKLGLPDEAAAAFKQFLGSDSATAKSKNDDAKSSLPDSLSSRLMGKTADGNWVGVVQAVLKKPSSDIDYVKTVLARSKVMLKPYQIAHPEMRIEVTGPYKDLEEVNNLEKNGLYATIVSIGLTLMIIFVFFRSIKSTFLVLFQAVFTCALVLALSVVTFGRLNLYTIFVAAIIFGAGTNYPIFILGYAQNLVNRGRTWFDALKETYHSLFISLVIACTTITAGMLTLLIARFAGFFEFGILGAAGIVFSMVLTLVFMPGYIFAFERIGSWPIWNLSVIQSSRSLRALGSKVMYFLADVFIAVVSLWVVYELAQAVRPAIHWDIKGILGVALAVICLIFGVVVMGYLFLSRTSKGEGVNWEKRLHQGAIVTLVLTALLAVFIPFKDFFEYDFSNLRDKTPHHDLPVGVATGSSRSSSQPVVVLANDIKTIKILHDTLLQRWNHDNDSYLRGFLDIYSFVPEDSIQQHRAPLIARIDSILADSNFKLASGKDSIQIAHLKAMAQSKPFHINDLPKWALDLVRERSGEVGRIGFVYGRFNSSDAREAAVFEKRYGPCQKDEQGKQKGGICLQGTAQANLFSSSFIYAEVVRYVREDAGKIFILMIVNLIVLLAMLMRSWRRTLICMIGMAVGAIWTLGLMGALGQKVNVFNLIALSDLQGVAVDTVSYLILEYILIGRKKIRHLLSNIGMLVAICELTTLAGYAGMLFTTHMGIISIGTFAVLGLASFLVTSLGLTPWLSLKLLDKEVKESHE